MVKIVYQYTFLFKRSCNNMIFKMATKAGMFSDQSKIVFRTSDAKYNDNKGIAK